MHLPASSSVSGLYETGWRIFNVTQEHFPDGILIAISDAGPFPRLRRRTHERQETTAWIGIGDDPWGITGSGTARERAGEYGGKREAKSEDEGAAGISGAGAADERDRKSENRSDNWRGRTCDEHESDRWKPAADRRRTGRYEEMAL